MHWTEIVTIVLVASFLLAMGIYYGRKINRGESFEECSCSSKKKKGKSKNPLVEMYHKEYGCSCNKKK